MKERVLKIQKISMPTRSQPLSHMLLTRLFRGRLTSHSRWLKSRDFGYANGLLHTCALLCARAHKIKQQRHATSNTLKVHLYNEACHCPCSCTCIADFRSRSFFSPRNWRERGTVCCLPLDVLYDHFLMHLTWLPFQRGLKDADHNDCFEDFLKHQGTTSIYLPPVTDTWGFTDAGPLNWGAVDVYGYMNDYIKVACPKKDLGTTVSGTCIKKTKNGKDAYIVHISTKNANMWAMHFSDLDLSNQTNSCPD
mmetsp:Transcript_16088/g.29087  ORF Transcript_16088/g.29087 Transcript_16088/m.29087 type:complete len:251 (-) Transcript_16088:488-1240(-)